MYHIVKPLSSFSLTYYFQDLSKLKVNVKWSTVKRYMASSLINVLFSKQQLLGLTCASLHIIVWPFEMIIDHIYILIQYFNLYFDFEKLH